MGGQIGTVERERRNTIVQQQQAEERQRATALATRIVGHLSRVVIRPGPKPEERECTEVARELETEIPALVSIILED